MSSSVSSNPLTENTSYSVFQFPLRILSITRNQLIKLLVEHRVLKLRKKKQTLAQNLLLSLLHISVFGSLHVNLDLRHLVDLSAQDQLYESCRKLTFIEGLLGAVKCIFQGLSSAFITIKLTYGIFLKVILNEQFNEFQCSCTCASFNTICLRPLLSL